VANAGSLKTGDRFTAGGKVWTVSAEQAIEGEVYATTMDGSGAIPAGVESGCYFRPDDEVEPHPEGCCCDACNPEYHPLACPCGCEGQAKILGDPAALLAAAKKAFPNVFGGQS
jgi:hypothetical protein